MVTIRALWRAVRRALVVAVAVSLPAHGAAPTEADCIEAAEFIANAALGRENGLRRDAFLERMRADFAAIRALPPALRWFVRDADDERLLLDAAAEVFDRPLAPARHREAFLARCRARVL